MIPLHRPGRLFYQVQAVLDGRVKRGGDRVCATTPTSLCEDSCAAKRGAPAQGSWSKGRNGRYAYYHCPRRCRAVNVSKAVLEGAFVDELALLQPTPGYMRLVKDRILCVWRQRCTEAPRRTAEHDRRVKAIRQKLDRLDEAFLYSESIDLGHLQPSTRQAPRGVDAFRRSTITPRPSTNST